MTVSTEKKRQEGEFAETLRVIVQALIIAVVIRTFLFQAFSIPSGSMEGTLLIGDYLFVSTYSYGYTHYTLPFSPKIFSGRVFGGQADIYLRLFTRVLGLRLERLCPTSPSHSQ